MNAINLCSKASSVEQSACQISLAHGRQVVHSLLEKVLYADVSQFPFRLSV